jgi:glycerophosphoryl diester phosphodiesterase
MKLHLSFLVFSLSVLSCTPKESQQINSSSKPIEVVAHRGANRLAPENTMASMQKAIEHGADYIEIDLATSMDGIFYCFHDRRLERTTNGEGEFSSKNSGYIDSLDAGSWFSPEFVNERIPRVSEMLKKAEGKTKIYFDVKDADIDKLIELIKAEVLEKDCFVWFSNRDRAKLFRSKAPHIPLKLNAKSPQEVIAHVETYNPQIIECDVFNITPELQQVCRENNLKLMANILRDSWWEYKTAIELQVDMVNLDHPDYFQSMLTSPGYEFKDYRLAAHRGGIIEDIYDEYDPRSIQAAIDSGYWMLEIDVQPTEDHHIIVHHDYNLERIFGIDKKSTEMTLTELKKLQAIHGGYAPLTFDEVVKICEGRIRFMMDLKPGNPEPWFNAEIKRVLEAYDMLDETYFIRDELKTFYQKGKYGFRMYEVDKMRARLISGENIAAHYYLFDHGNRINAEVARWCQKNHIEICASVNVGHYRMEHHFNGAMRDIDYLKKSGVTLFQIDSQYDDFFNLDIN